MFFAAIDSFRPKCPSRRVSAFRSLAALGALVLAAVWSPAPAPAANSAEELVEEATKTAENFLRDPDFEFMRSMIREAYGIVIIPTLTKGGFILGAEGGSALILGRRADGTWGYPSFHTLLSASIGLQIGGQVSQVVLVVRNRRGLESLIQDSVKLGADASVAVGPVGGGVKGGTTTNFNADIVAFSKAQGLFGGGAIEGGTLSTNEDRNQLFYGRPLSSRAIILEHQGANPLADRLREILPH